ncbi:MAG: glycosyltransferase family 39 protein [Candidatus Solibacter usitatus]|nr:glycosyltransferase family 39 protein [Candidatus Solibacter usitatus]
MDRLHHEGSEIPQGLERAARHALSVAAAFALLKLAVHLLTNGQYGFFRDELCYIAYGRHLDWGYPDGAPAIAWTAWFVHNVLGDSLRALRFLPALAGAGKVLLTGLICIEMGGGSFAVALACLGVTAAPIFLGVDTLFSMNAFEPLFWSGAVLCVLRAIRRGDERWLLWAGVCLGLGLEFKHSTAFFALCLLAGLALGGQRHLFRSGWLWLGAAAAFLLFLPNLIWQYRHDWATYTLLMNVKRTHKNVDLSAAQFLFQQVLMLLPISLLLWGAGLWQAWRQTTTRFVTVTYVCFFLLMLAMAAKSYYLAPAYPMLFAAGAVWWAARPNWARIPLAACILAMALFVSPLVLPMLPVEKFIAYQRWTGLEPPKTERAHSGPLPQMFGDMFGWPETVEKIARAYHALPAGERAKTKIFCNNYGEAGAVDFFGPRYGLPNAICPHQGYFYFGYNGLRKGDTVIVTQSRIEDARKSCGSVEVLDRIGHPYAMAEEHYDLLLCRDLQIDPAEAWPRMKHWN